jgi:hypothetical protein
MNMPNTATKTLIRAMISSFDQPGDVEMGSMDGDIDTTKASARYCGCPTISRRQVSSNHVSTLNYDFIQHLLIP